MAKNTKTLEGYVTSLLILGILLFTGGLLFAVIVLNASHPDGWLLYYFHFKALGAILAYLYVSWWNPGGRVTINFDKATYTDAEKTLDKLIIKYRSNAVMLLAPILYLGAEFMVSRIRTQPQIGTVEGYVTSIVIGAFVSLTLCLGIKYLSAWWNIKRNWKKEFGK